MKLKKYKKKTIRTYFYREIIIIIIAIIIAIIIINNFSYKYNKELLSIAEAETQKYVTSLINNATKEIKIANNLYEIEKEVNEIKMVTYNTYQATKLINEITNNIQNKLADNYNLIIAEVPLGIVFNNSLMKNFGPKVKVKIATISDIISELQTEVKPYGINNALVEVKVKIDATARVVLPLSSKIIKINNTIPISINIVNGNIPEAYISTYN